MADKPQTSGLDYGHRTYMDADDYMSSMSRPSDKAYDNQFKRPHSDDKKPYMDDDYPEMEYYWTPYDPPNFIPPGVPDDPRTSLPPGYPDRVNPPEEDPQIKFLGCLFKIPQGPFVVGNGETTYSGIGFLAEDPIARLYVNYGPADLLINVQTLNQCLTALIAKCLVSVQVKETFNGDDYYKIGEYYPVQVVAVTRAGKVCAWDFMATNCPPEIEFAWDYENSAETIARSANVDLYVEGGTTPFTWTVEGEGFTLAQGKTTGRHNTLFADGSSCGAAIITVTDACDTEVVASIRNTTSGVWNLKSNDCGYAGDDPNGWTRAGLTYGDNFTWTGQAISGYQKQDQVLKSYYGSGYGPGWIFNSQADCQADQLSRAAGYPLTSECLVWESPLNFGSTGFGGLYYRKSGRFYAHNCVYSDPLNKWTYIYGLFEPEPISLAYYEWECP